MAKSMTPAKRHAIRAMYEAKDQAKRNERLGLKPKFINKGKKKKWFSLPLVISYFRKIIYQGW